MKFQSVSILLIIISLTMIITSSSLHAEWIHSGPDNAMISYSIVIDPGDSNTVYCTTYSRGILKSVDYGINWELINTGLPVRTDSSYQSFWWWFGSYRSGRLFINPHNSQYLYYTQGDSGLYMSSDAGEEWVEIEDELLENPGKGNVAFDPYDTLSVYLASRGLFRSEDHGISWEVIEGIPENANRCSEIVFDPQEEGKIYLSCYPASGLYCSQDYGETWELLYGGNIHNLSINPVETNSVLSGLLFEYRISPLELSK